MNREAAPGKSPEEMYVQQKVRVLLMLKKMGSNVSLKFKHTAYIILKSAQFLKSSFHFCS